MEELNQKLKIFKTKEFECLIEKLSKYIYDIVKNDKEINEKFIYKIIEIILKERNLGNYLKKISIDNNNHFIYAEYNFFECENEITINLRKIINHIEKKYKWYGSNEKKIILFYEIVEVCCHEMEHVNQVKICNENKNNLETKILRLSTIYKSTMKELAYELYNNGYCNICDSIKFADYQVDISNDDKLYFLRPDERLAEVLGQLISLNIFLNIFSDINYLKEIGLFYIYEILYYGYETYLSPLKEYLIKFNKYVMFDELEKNCISLNYLERALYGFNLSELEKEQIKKMKNKYSEK